MLLATSFENECDYCMAAHSMVAGIVGMDDATRRAVRQGDPLPDARLNALWGFSREVVTGVAMKTMSNCTNHLAETPLDEAFEAHRWASPERGKKAD